MKTVRDSSSIITHFASFALGIMLVFATSSGLNFFKDLVFGFEVQSLASFPYEHIARVRSRPGMGDQTLFLEVDGQDVWSSGDMPGGDLKEKLSWDAAGKIVSLKIQERSLATYDAESKALIVMENQEAPK